MKKILLVLYLFITLNFLGQEKNEFNITTDYYLTEIDSISKDTYWKLFTNNHKTEPISISLKNKQNKEIFVLKIDELETYTETLIKVMKTSNLKNISEVIQLESDYNACCSNYNSTYLLKTNTGKIIKLPETNYDHCDGPTPIIEYRFANQKFGIKNKILLVKSFLNENYKVDSVEVKKTYNWNGIEFKLEK